MIPRRVFLATAGLSLTRALHSRNLDGLKIGAMDTIFRMAGNPEAVAVAHKLGLAAVQVTLGKSADGKTLPLESSSLQQKWLEASKKYGVPLDSTYLDMLHEDCLKNNPNAPMWVRKGIQITKNLNAPVLMLVFFGKCQVLQRSELDSVI